MAKDMDFVSVIEHKKRGLELTNEEIRAFAAGAADGSVKDYQLAALLMAIRLNGMTDRETRDLTLAMAESGDMLDPDVGGVPVDKHSTGGVGDTTTLILAPLVAACGGKVLKMSGRGLGHTGGTIDKMESIPGMRVTMPEEEFVRTVREIGCCVVGQSAQLAPADKRLYALRDVTATVDSVPLIASSILSKKFASGARAIVLDVKTGSGALMPTEEDSIALAGAMVRIGALSGRKITAVISGMEEPLGSHVGNALEVKEAIDVLSRRCPEDLPLTRVALYLGAHMLTLSGVAKDMDSARAMLLEKLRDGSGLDKLREMIVRQGEHQKAFKRPVGGAGGVVALRRAEVGIAVAGNIFMQIVDITLEGENAFFRFDDVFLQVSCLRFADQVYRCATVGHHTGKEGVGLFHEDKIFTDFIGDAKLVGPNGVKNSVKQG